MKPYYEQSGITIFCGDCREVLPMLFETRFRDGTDLLPSAVADVLITDPPYGVELGTSDRRGDKHGLAKSKYLDYTDTFEQFCAEVVPTINDALGRVVRGAVFAGKHITLYAPPDALGGIYCPAGVGRGCWGFTCFFPILLYGSNPTLQNGAQSTVLYSTEAAENNGHPCPKPLGWMCWLVGMASLPGELIIDPFMGSGTTLVAAKNGYRKAIGIERSEAYCEIAARRLQQEALPLEMGA